MSDQRICDLDGTIIVPETDQFYTVTDGRTGARRDICGQCARSRSAPIPWEPNVPRAVGQRVTPVDNSDGRLVYDVTT